MTEKSKSIYDLTNDQSSNVTLRICSNSGDIFQEIFPLNQTTFADVKYLAMKFLLDKNEIKEKDNYKLISINLKRTIEEEKTLRQERVKNGDEFFLTRKFSNESTKVEQTSEDCLIDEKLIRRRTNNLPSPSNIYLQAHHLTRRTEFRTDLNRILLTLIETSHKLLWYRSDAEEIFRQVEKILSQSSTPSSSDEIEINPSFINKLIDIGFTEQQARFALKQTKSDFNAAMELLLTEPDIDKNENENENQCPISSYSHDGPFIPFRQFRQKYFQPNPIAIQSLEDMGFSRNEIINALHVCHNDQNLTCDYLIGDKQQQQNIIDTDNEQGFDPNSNLFKALMENPIVQQAVNNPKTFYIILHLYENPNLVAIYMNEIEIANLLLQLSRIYYSERYQTDRLNSNQNEDLENNEN